MRKFKDNRKGPPSRAKSDSKGKHIITYSSAKHKPNFTQLYQHT